MLSSEEAPPREVLNGRYRFLSSLRCDGVGKLDCVEDVHTGQRRVVRWFPLEVNRYNNQNIVHLCAHLPLHPNLPEVPEVGEMDSWAYMVVDFPEGQLFSLGQEILRPEAWRNMAAQLSSALSALHAQQVFHGELCMTSILKVGEEQGEEQYFLWDMPLVLSSRMAERRQEDRVLRQLTRTVASMAPERARGGPVVPESDIYSLGTLLAYGIGSEPPCNNSTLTIVHAIANDKFKPKLPDILPPAYADMLERMLASHTSGRPNIFEIEAFFLRPLSDAHKPAPKAVFMGATTPNLPIPALAPAARNGKAASSREPASLVEPEVRNGNAPPSPPPEALKPGSPTVSGVDWIQMISEKKAIRSAAMPSAEPFAQPHAPKPEQNLEAELKAELEAELDSALAMELIELEIEEELARITDNYSCA
ncbi:MAG: protein kinase [Cystobacterineae bacterium]|nr:protein kinase [Cystobacterineae bacterium]